MTLRAILDALLPHVRPPTSLLPGAPNPIAAWLDAVGLPWRTPRAELAARFGIHADNPYAWDLVSLDIRPPPLQAMLWPLGFQAFPRYAPAMPPGTLSTHISLGDDAEENIGCAARQFSAALGARPVQDKYNTRHVEWRWGAACVSLTTWPPRMQSGPKLTNPAHDRDLRLVTACSVSVQTGWRPPLSEEDRLWLAGLTPWGATRNWDGSRHEIGQTRFAETLLQFMRDPPADLAALRGRFGLSADRAALIACEDALYILPLANVAGFEVRRTLPGKGGGGSALTARCTTGYAACPTKQVPIAEGSHADDLTEIASCLAEATRKPLHLADYDTDV